jgi:putative ABC transport system substrate-binding protein
MIGAEEDRVRERTIAPAMSRRWFVAQLPIALLAARAYAQPRPLPRIGILSPGAPASQMTAPLVEGLRVLGYLEGQNIAFEYRWAPGNFDRLPGLASELVEARVDVIVALATQASVAAKQATATIPVVMAGVADPVASGIIASLGRPGGNVTGTSNMAAAIAGKQLEVLKEAVPRVTRVAVLWNPANKVFQALQLREVQRAGRKLGLQLHLIGAQSSDDLERAFRTITQQRAEALHLLADPLLTANADTMAELIARHRIPAVAGVKRFAEAGAFITYGPNYEDSWRLAAAYVDRILRGAKPADLPVEQSTKFELVINLRTAKSLGLTLPPSLVLRADKLIE